MIIAAWLQVGWAFSQGGPSAATPIASAPATDYYSLMTITATVTVTGMPDATFRRSGYPVQALHIYRDLKEWTDANVPFGALMHVTITTTVEKWHHAKTASGVVSETMVSREAPQVQVAEWNRK